MPGKRAPNPRQQLFLSEYLKDGNGTRAAIAAGYSAKNARQTAHYLTHQVTAVVDALAETRTAIAAKTEYDAIAAMGEAETAMAFALQSNNANAYVKAVELRAKLMGLLIDRIDLRAQLIDIAPALDSARRRAFVGPVIDVEGEAVVGGAVDIFS